MFEQYPLRFMFAFGIAVTAAIGFGVAWFRSSRRVRELEDRVLRALTRRNEPEPSFDTLDNIAARVDDIANGQDFLNRVLSERLGRLPNARPAREAREVTPV